MPLINFDFAGALPLARSLRIQADLIRSRSAIRRRVAEAALVDWAGPHADTFKIAMLDQDDLASRTEQMLRDDADAWAQAWADAMNAENERRYQDAVDRAREDWSWVVRISEAFAGDGIPDSVGAPPAPLTAPRPPQYWTTGEFWHE